MKNILILIVSCFIIGSAFCIPTVPFLTGRNIVGQSNSLSAQYFDNTSPHFSKEWLLWTVVQTSELSFPTDASSYIISYYQRNNSKTGLQWLNGTAVPLYNCNSMIVPSGSSFVPKGSGSSSTRVYVGCAASYTKKSNIAWEYDITNDDLRTFNQVFNVPYVSTITQFVGLSSQPGFVFGLGEITSTSFQTILKFDLATLTVQNYTQIETPGSFGPTYLITDDKYLYLSTGYSTQIGQLLIYDGDLNLIKNITQNDIISFGSGSFAPLQSLMIFFGINCTDFPYLQKAVFIAVDTEKLEIVQTHLLTNTESGGKLPGYSSAVDLSSTNYFSVLGSGIVQLDINSFSIVGISQHIPFPPYTLLESNYAAADPVVLTPIPSGVLYSSSTAPTVVVGCAASYTNITLFVTPIVPV